MTGRVIQIWNWTSMYGLSLSQSFTNRNNFVFPRDIESVSRKMDCHDWGWASTPAFSGWKPGMLPNILQGTRQHSQQRITWSKMQ